MSLIRRLHLEHAPVLNSWCIWPKDPRVGPVVLYERFVGRVVKVYYPSATSPGGCIVYKDEARGFAYVPYGLHPDCELTMYASAEVDTSAALRMRYEDFLASKARQKWIEASQKREEMFRARLADMVTRFKITEDEARDLIAHSFGPGEYTIVATLLATKKFRSEFRRSCCDQVRHWLAAPEDRQYPNPLSTLQYKKLGIQPVMAHR